LSSVSLPTALEFLSMKLHPRSPKMWQCRRYLSSTASVPKVPQFITLKELGKKLQIAPEILLRHVGFKQDRKVHVSFDPPRTKQELKSVKLETIAGTKPMDWSSPKHFQFKSIQHVVVPYYIASRMAAQHNKKIEFGSTEPVVSWSKLVDFHKNSSGTTKLSEIRRPVVVLLGHFNHGKTTLLDTMIGSGSHIVAEESHGITQEIRAATVPLKKKNGVFMTVIDTPGQDIFYGMRSGGAEIADFAILMISAVDGISRQTEECIGCIQDLKLPAVACINKVSADFHFLEFEIFSD
jgi:small GTP-binding protein